MTAADRGQLTRLAILFGQHGIEQRADRLRLCSDHAGRYLTSMSLLTAAEAAALEHRLHSVNAEGLRRRLAHLIGEEEDRAALAAAAAGQPAPAAAVSPPAAAVVDKHADQLDLFAEE